MFYSKFRSFQKITFQASVEILILRLSVYKLDSSTATMPTSASAYLQDGSVATQTQALTYETSAATTANLGDHMELRLEAVGASTVLRDYSWVKKQACLI